MEIETEHNAFFKTDTKLIHMKLFRHFCLLMAVMAAGTAFAQTTQTGLVQEYNEKAKKTPLAGVELTVRSANTTSSDKDGKFSLQFLTLKPGEKVNVRRIEKLGYDIFNKEAVEQWNINPSQPFMIVMCRSDKFKKIRDNYEKVSSESYARQLKKEEDTLAKLKAEGKMKEEEYNRQLIELRENYDRQLDNLDNYIDKFSRIDLSELSQTEQEIIELVQEGKIEEAIKKYEEQHYVDQYAKEVAQLKEVSSAIDQLQDIKSQKETARDELLAAIDRQVEVLQLAGGRENLDKITVILKDVADADSSDFETQLNVARHLIRNIADYNLAEEYLLRAEKTVIAKYGADSDEAVSVYWVMGDLYKATEEFNKALEYCKKCENVTLAIFGHDAQDMGKIYNNVGAIHFELGNYNDALEYYNKSMAINEKDPETFQFRQINVLKNIANCLSALGRYDEALSTQEKALAACVELYGENDTRTADSYAQTAQALQNMGKYNEALDNFEKSLTIRIRFYGEEHPDVASCYNGIGHLYSEVGYTEEAIEYYEKALSIRKKIFGDFSLSVAFVMNNLASEYLQLHMYSDALELYKRAIDIHKAKLGEGHPDLLSMYNNLGSAYDGAKQYEEGIEILNKVLEFGEKNIGPNHDTLGHTYTIMGYIYSHMGELQKALDCHVRASEIFEKNYGENHSKYATAIHNIGNIFKKAGQYDLASEYFQKSFDITKNIFGADSPNLGQSYMNMGELAIAAGKYDEAVDCYSSGYNIFSKAYGDSHNYSLTCLSGQYEAFHESFKTDFRLRDRYDEFMADKTIVAVVADETMPAAQQGMSGMYEILDYNDWNFQNVDYFFARAQEYVPMSKTLTLHKDGVINTYEFPDKMGLSMYLKTIGKEKKDSMTALYNEWKSQNRD